MLIFGLLGLAWAQPGLAQEHEHHEHNMTAAMFAELREKVPLYREYTDEQIVDSMNRMGPNFRVYLSDQEVKGPVGILALGHGFEAQGNEEFQNAFGAIAEARPTAVGLGMAMMTSAHIQNAVDEITAAGAETLVVIPTTTVEYGGLTRQWGYIFGLEDEAAWMSVAQVKTDAGIIMAPTPTRHPILSAILLDYAREYSRDPGREVVAIVSHGPVDPEDNRRELDILAEHAARIGSQSEFAEVRGFTLQDDAPSAVRSANVSALRQWVELHRETGHRVIVLTTLPVKGSVHAKIERDLAGLSYEFNRKGVLLHPKFGDWVSEVVAQSLNPQS